MDAHNQTWIEFCLLLWISNKDKQYICTTQWLTFGDDNSDLQVYVCVCVYASIRIIQITFTLK